MFCRPIISRSTVFAGTIKVTEGRMLATPELDKYRAWKGEARELSNKAVYLRVPGSIVQKSAYTSAIQGSLH
jgi:hypothetical protein